MTSLSITPVFTLFRLEDENAKTTEKVLVSEQSIYAFVFARVFAPPRANLFGSGSSGLGLFDRSPRELAEGCSVYNNQNQN
jgi:hypothetical protein